jgi:hypothetical protein
MPLSGTNRLYGRVVTDRGQEYTGFIRWDRNEGSWADLLDANKGATQSGIRFGHVSRIDDMGRSGARFTLKSGEVVELGSRSSDLGPGLRALLVDQADGSRAELGWDDLQLVEFQPTPRNATPAEGRLYGTLVTDSGLEFTGYVTWDVDEIYSSDVLDGEEGRLDRKVPFGAIQSIQRNGSGSARVVLHDGTAMVLSGTNDVNSSNSGISVSDPALGQVLVGWDEFVGVRFHGTAAEETYDSFDGGGAIRGTVVTARGEKLSGRIVWDDDEAYSWEMLNGSADGLQFQVEFGNIAEIQKTRRGALVTLHDGRAFELTGSNDVNSGNRGIHVEVGNRTYRVGWSDFVSLALER